MSGMEQIIYSKYANERADRFILRTDVVRKENGEFVVRKRALSEAAKVHVDNICIVGEALSEQYEGTRFAFNKCTRVKDGVELEFINSNTLAERADKLLYSGMIKEAKALIFAITDEIYKVKETQEFRMTKEFEEVFGKVCFGGKGEDESAVNKRLACAKVSDIDILLGNIMEGKIQGTIIDYEWSFTFPIPLNFIVYRLIHYYTRGNQARGILNEWEMYKEAGLSDSELVAYEQMERHFQDVYVLTNADKSHYMPLRDMYNDIADGQVDVRDLYETVNNMAVNQEERDDVITMLVNRAKLQGESEELKKELAEKNAKMSAMENTKVWKAYRKYRDFREK